MQSYEEIREEEEKKHNKNVRKSLMEGKHSPSSLELPSPIPSSPLHPPLPPTPFQDNEEIDITTPFFYSFLLSFFGFHRFTVFFSYFYVVLKCVVGGVVVGWVLVGLVLNFKKALPLLVVLLLYITYKLSTSPTTHTYIKRIKEKWKREREREEEEGGGGREREWVRGKGKWIKRGICVVVIVFLVVMVGMSVGEDWGRGQALLGFFIIPGCCVLLSCQTSHINISQCLGGITMQLFFGVIFLRLGVGYSVISYLGDIVVATLSNLTPGVEFVFGDTLPTEAFFAFTVLPTALFVSSLMAVLQYLGVLQAVVASLGKLMQVTVGVTSAEALSVAANVFLGQTEAPLVVKPLLKYMSPSEIQILMTGGFATISGSVLAAFIEMGLSPPFLLSASVMGAPGSLGISKILLPESSDVTSDNVVLGDKQEEKDLLKDTDTDEPQNVFQAAGNGAILAIPLMANIAVSLISFIALFSLLNMIVGYCGEVVGVEGLSIESLFGYLFYPVAFIMGVPPKDCHAVGELLVVKLFLNEFVAYEQLIEMRGEISERAYTISTFALCGFANFSSVGMQLGGFAALLPERKNLFAKRVLFAMFGGFCTSLMSGTIACLLGVETDLETD